MDFVEFEFLWNTRKNGDAAGIKASFRGIDLVLEEGLNIRVLLLPDGEDPDSFSRKKSSQKSSPEI